MEKVKIEAELTQDEYAVLLLMLGAGTSGIFDIKPSMAKTVMITVNKLLANQPGYKPYDVDSFDPAAKGFPFKTTKVQ